MDSAERAEAAQLKAKQGRLILVHALLHLTTLCIPGNAETILFQELVGGDVVRADRLLAVTMSANAAIEFVLAPTVGRLTDSLGRKPFFLGYPTYGVVGWTLMFLFPRNYWVVVIGRTLGWVGVTMGGGTGITSVALSDLLSGAELAKANSEFFAVIGAGVLLGQVIGDNIMIAFGQPRCVHTASASASA